MSSPIATIERSLVGGASLPADACFGEGFRTLALCRTVVAAQATNLCSQLLGACGELFSSGFKHPFEVGILRFAQMSGGVFLPLSASAAPAQTDREGRARRLLSDVAIVFVFFVLTVFTIF
jgi:hypothetical protein